MAGESILPPENGGLKEMRHLTAGAVTVLLACLGLAGTVSAQVPQPVQIQGTIQAANCQTGQVTMSTSTGNDTFQVTNQTAAYVNGSAVSVCSLQSYVGDQATAVLIPTGSGFALSQINVTAQAAPPSSSSSIFSSPIVIGVGAALLGGIIGYLIGHNSAGRTVYTPTYTPYNYTTTPVYFPAGALPLSLPYNYASSQPVYYQGHYFYQCANGGWTMNQQCNATSGGGQDRPELK